MKITDIQCHVMAVPGPDGRTLRRNWIFVEISTDAGVAGIGEATTEYHDLAVVAQIESELRPRLIGMDPTDIERIWQLGYRDFWWRRGVVHTSAMSGIDQALWDIAGKVAGQPVFKLLGGRVRDQVRCYTRTDSSTGTPEDVAMDVRRDGFDAYKHSAGTPTRPFDLKQQVDVAVDELSRMRAAFGPNVDLMIDAHGWFDLVASCALVEKLVPLDMFFIEEPMNQDRLDDYVRLKQAFPGIRIAAGERLMTRWDCRPWFERQAIDICQVDISHTGGVSELMRIATYAETYHITIAPHNPYGPVALAASAHAAAAMPNFLILEHCRLKPWFDKIQQQPLSIKSGYINVDELATRTGLGIELNMDVVRRCAQKHESLDALSYQQTDGSTPLF